MAESKNKITAQKDIRKGLAIYKTGQSVYWFLRLWDPQAKRYVRKSTKETVRLEAIDAAVEYADNYKSKGHPKLAAKKDASFEHYALKAIDIAKASGVASRIKDHRKFILRPEDGLIAHFGKQDVSKITRGDMRDYLSELNNNRDEPLAPTYLAQHCNMIRKVLGIALDDGVIQVLPPMPKISKKPQPRAGFTDREYRTFMKTLRQSIAAKDVVKGAEVTPEWENLFKFIVHSWLRPVASELFGLRYRDVEVARMGKYLTLTIPDGKTGYRTVKTMPLAASIFTAQKLLHPDTGPNDYVFLPQYPNRNTASRKTGEVFNHIVEACDMKHNQLGAVRTTYSFRHYAFQSRLRSGGVDPFTLAKNAGTSVEMLEKVYARFMELSDKQIAELHDI